MSKRLRDIVDQYLIKHGTEGLELLSKAVGKSERSVSRWLDKGVPNANAAFKLALACGLEEQEALNLARKERLSNEAKTA